MPDNYSILGLTSTASIDEVKRAYRRLAMKYHPDKNPAPDAKQKFMQITKAYDDLLAGKKYASSFTSRSRSYPAAASKPQSKTREEQRHEKMARMQEHFNVQLMNERAALGNGKMLEEKRKAAYLEINVYFALCGICVLIGFALPILMGKLSLLIFTLPVSLSGAEKIYRKASKNKLKAEMLFSSKTQFTIQELTRYFSKVKTGGLWDNHND